MPATRCLFLLFGLLGLNLLALPAEPAPAPLLLADEGRALQPIIVYGTIAVGSVILAEAALSTSGSARRSRRRRGG